MKIETLCGAKPDNELLLTILYTLPDNDIWQQIEKVLLATLSERKYLFNDDHIILLGTGSEVEGFTLQYIVHQNGMWIRDRVTDTLENLLEYIELEFIQNMEWQIEAQWSAIQHGLQTESDTMQWAVFGK